MLLFGSDVVACTTAGKVVGSFVKVSGAADNGDFTSTDGPISTYGLCVVVFMVAGKDVGSLHIP